MADRSGLYKNVVLLEEKLRRSVEGKAGSSGKLRQLKLSLLEALEMGSADSRLARAARRVRGGKRLLDKIIRKVKDKQFAILRAIYDHAHMGAGLKSACSRWGCRSSDVMAAIELGKTLGRQLGSFTADLSPLDLGCLSDVKAAHEEVVVHLSHRALEDMLLSTLEGYQVPKTARSRFTEVYGVCLGMVRDEPVSRKGGGKYWRKHVYVHQAAVQLRAKGTRDHVWPNSRSIETQLVAAKVLFPHLEVIGDFHSHPYNSAKSLRRWEGWEPSEDDYTSNYRWVKTMRENLHNPCVAFIIAIGKQERAPRSDLKVKKQNVRFIPIGRNLVAVSAYRILQDAFYEANGIELWTQELLRTQ